MARDEHSIPPPRPIPPLQRRLGPSHDGLRERAPTTRTDAGPRPTPGRRGGSGPGAAARTRQTLIGLALAAAIATAWLAIHLGGIFAWTLAPANLPAAAALVLVQAWLSTGLFIVAHDAMHGSLAPGRPRVNRAVGMLALGMYAGLDYRRLEPKHHLHHRHVGTGDDPDFSADHPRSAPRWFLRFFRTYYTHAQIGRITVVAIAYMLLGASLLNIAVFWAAPALLALLQLFYFGTYLPHRHDERPFADRHRARSTSVGPLLSLLTCYHFGGYHHEHHLSPGTPWWALPAYRRGRGAERAPAFTRP